MNRKISVTFLIFFYFLNISHKRYYSTDFKTLFFIKTGVKFGVFTIVFFFKNVVYLVKTLQWLVFPTKKLKKHQKLFFSEFTWVGVFLGNMVY